MTTINTLPNVESIPTAQIRVAEPPLKVKLLSDNAKLPTRGTPGSSGLDVYTPIDFVIPAWGDAIIPLDIAVDIPYG